MQLHRWWLYACCAAALLAGWAGGFSTVVTALFIAIYLTGAVLIGPVDEDESVEADDDIDQTL